MIGDQLQLNADGTLTISCKVPGKWLPLLQAICDIRGTNMNNLLKMCIQFLIETAKVTTDPSPDMKVLLHMMRVDANWQDMFNYVKNNELDIARCILILQQAKDGKPCKGFGLAMFNKPYCGDCSQTLNVDEIVERIIEVALGRDDYWNIRSVVSHFDAKSIREALIRMVDAQNVIITHEEDEKELPGADNAMSNGKPYEYGRRTRQTKSRTPDSIDTQQRIIFTDDDKEAAYQEANGYGEDKRITFTEDDKEIAYIESTADEDDEYIRPFGVEW